jgi:hypothetical protein
MIFDMVLKLAENFDLLSHESDGDILSKIHSGLASISEFLDFLKSYESDGLGINNKDLHDLNGYALYFSNPAVYEEYKNRDDDFSKKVKKAILDTLNKIKNYNNVDFLIKKLWSTDEDYRYITNIDFNKFSEDDKIRIVSVDGQMIEYMENPSEEVQLAAVKQNPYNIHKIKNPSPAVEDIVTEQDRIF